ncbi:MAG TPA: thiamine-binding protein [Chitinophagales bacterium]|nr:thiamine-binding protein [Chitinophagales bacterium]
MIINASIQVVPLTQIDHAFPVIDKAIALIQQSGLKYTVGAFETTIEGEYEPVQQLIRTIEDFCYAQPDIQFLVYKKMHVHGGGNVLVESKTGKFKQL